MNTEQRYRSRLFSVSSWQLARVSRLEVGRQTSVSLSATSASPRETLGFAPPFPSPSDSRRYNHLQRSASLKKIRLQPHGRSWPMQQNPAICNTKKRTRPSNAAPAADGAESNSLQHLKNAFCSKRRGRSNNSARRGTFRLSTAEPRNVARPGATFPRFLARRLRNEQSERTEGEDAPNPKSQIPDSKSLPAGTAGPTPHPHAASADSSRTAAGRSSPARRRPTPRSRSRARACSRGSGTC